MAAPKYLAIARKWRPQTFDEIVGQDHITRTLKNAITSNRIHHAFLFIGSRGIGKTTSARILAKALNCTSTNAPTVTPCGVCDNCVAISEGSSIDVIEIDGASNNTVEDVREIRENIRMVPTSGRYKVYIIDEVHQLSPQAFNALLKTLEEPPSHAIFVLATTEAHKIPSTIISRCQRYDFRRVAIKDLVALLKVILKKEKMRASDEALHAIARAAEGGVRDAESILDELITYCEDEITFKDVFDVLGLVEWQVFHDLCDAMRAGNVTRQLEMVEDIAAAGKDLSQFVEDILRYYRNLLVCRTTQDATETLLRLPEAEVEKMTERAKLFPVTKLLKLVEQFAELVNGFDSQISQRTALEALLIRLSRVDVEVSLDTVMEKLLLLGGGGIADAGVVGSRVPDTPPNPPEAGPRDTAPAAPASDRRMEFIGSRMEQSWRTLVLQADKSNSQLSLFLGRVAPLSLDDGILSIEFEPGADFAFNWISGPENRATFERFLQEETTNVRGFDARLAPRAIAAAPAPAPGPDDEAAKEEGVSKQQQALLLEDAGIAAVVHEFKGVIVEVRRVQADDAEPTSR